MWNAIVLWGLPVYGAHPLTERSCGSCYIASRGQTVYPRWKVERITNLKTAKAVGLTFPLTLIATTD